MPGDVHHLDSVVYGCERKLLAEEFRVPDLNERLDVEVVDVDQRYHVFVAAHHVGVVA